VIAYTCYIIYVARKNDRGLLNMRKTVQNAITPLHPCSQGLSPLCQLTWDSSYTTDKVWSHCQMSNWHCTLLGALNKRDNTLTMTRRTNIKQRTLT